MGWLLVKLAVFRRSLQLILPADLIAVLWGVLKWLNWRSVWSPQLVVHDQEFTKWGLSLVLRAHAYKIFVGAWYSTRKQTSWWLISVLFQFPSISSFSPKWCYICIYMTIGSIILYTYPLLCNCMLANPKPLHGNSYLTWPWNPLTMVEYKVF